MIAVSSGSGKLLRVSLELIDACMETSSSDVPLAVADADVVVKIQNQKTDVKNDFVDKSVTVVVDTNNLSNIALQDDQSYHGSPVVSNGKFESVGVRSQPNGRDRSHHNRIIPHHLTPLEVGMYILLAVFCAAISIFVASCFVYASKFRRQDYPLQTKAQSVQNAHDWVWLGKSNRQSVECGSEINITTNPRSDLVCDDQFVSGTNSTSSKSRTRTMASGHLPPPGHPAHGSPPFQQVTPELIRYGPYQQSHRYHQQMLMHRPHRFLPATPMNQRLSPVYQNNNVLTMAEFERQQQEQIMLEAAAMQEEQHRMMMERETSLQRQQRYVEDNHDDDVIADDDDDNGVVVTNVIGNPMESEAVVERVSTRPKIDSATYTKKAGALTYFDDEYDRGRLILPVGYPYYRNSSPKVSDQVTYLR